MLLACATAGCGGDGNRNSLTSAADTPPGFKPPSKVTSGGRVIYVLEDVSCDMEEPRERRNRIEALRRASYAAAFDRGRIEVGVVRENASQNVQFEGESFDSLIRDDQPDRFQVKHALEQAEAVFTRLRPYAGRPTGKQGCSSDLLGALGAIRTQQQALEQREGRKLRADVVFVTNGLIVDRASRIFMTQAAIEKPRIYKSVLAAIEKSYGVPDLKGITVWLVGLGYDKNITNRQRGPLIQEMWKTILRGAGARPTDPVQSADVLPALLELPGPKS
jgi:hypothetical protein